MTKAKWEGRLKPIPISLGGGGGAEKEKGEDKA